MRSAKKKKGSWVKRMLLIAGACIGLVMASGAAYAGYLYVKTQNAIGNISANPADQPPAENPRQEQEPEDKLKAVTFLLAGVDRRQGSGGTLNADVLMVVALDPNTRAATIVSIPRDVHLKPEGLPPQKANYYYAYYYNKDRETAIENTRRMFSDVLQIPIDYMAVVDFDGFRQIVDALGGLEIEVDMDMRYVDNADGTNINLKKGTHLLNGKETLDFVRYRKSNRGTAESSDTARNMRQQQVLEKMLAKMTSFSGILQWGNILDIVGKSVKTDIPEAQIRAWIADWKKWKPDTLEFIPINGRWESPYIIPSSGDLLDAVTALRTRIGMETEDEDELLRTLVKRIDTDHSEGSTVTGSTYGQRTAR